jgi:PAS domain S-box-containing protein
MHTFSKRSTVIACFALLLAVLIGDAFITRRQVNMQIGTALLVVHTRQVLLELSQTELLLENAEAGQRGFLYTGRPEYLFPYDLAVSRVESYIEGLATLTAGNPRQRAMIGPLRALTSTKLAEMAQTIALYRAGKQEDAERIVLADTGLVTMDKIRDIISQMENEEIAMDAARQAAYQRSIRLTRACIVLTTILAALGLVFLAYYILREIDLREKHSRDLNAREERFRVTLTSISEAVIATDQNGSVTFLNPTAEALTGINAAAAAGKNIFEVFPIFNQKPLAETENPDPNVIQEANAIGLANHMILRKPDGTLMPIDDSAAPIHDDSGNLIGVVLVFRDTTQDLHNQELIRKAEKLSAAARLAATVAHEINNPLEAITNLVYISKSAAGVPASVVSQLAQAEQELERVAHITRQTLGFYRDSTAPEPVQLDALIDTVFRLYSNKFKTKNITVERRFGKCPRILGVQGELMQVLSNLVSNAADAVAIDGTITATLEFSDVPGSTAIQMEIEDDGPGVAQENVGRIFEPFFTTKQDVGTGLGLWVSREIIERQGGAISVGNRKDGKPGAVFTIVFPAVVDSPTAPRETAQV